MYQYYTQEVTLLTTVAKFISETLNYWLVLCNIVVLTGLGNVDWCFTPKKISLWIVNTKLITLLVSTSTRTTWRYYIQVQWLGWYYFSSIGGPLVPLYTADCRQWAVGWGFCVPIQCSLPLPDTHVDFCRSQRKYFVSTKKDCGNFCPYLRKGCTHMRMKVSYKKLV